MVTSLPVSAKIVEVRERWIAETLGLEACRLAQFIFKPWDPGTMRPHARLFCMHFHTRPAWCRWSRAREWGASLTSELNELSDH